jgi:hypothetical protein
LPLTNRSVNRVIDEYVALRERQQTQGRTSFHMLRTDVRTEQDATLPLIYFT